MEELTFSSAALMGVDMPKASNKTSTTARCLAGESNFRRLRLGELNLGSFMLGYEFMIVWVDG
jgi:hypothetical protein